MTLGFRRPGTPVDGARWASRPAEPDPSALRSRQARVGETRRQSTNAIAVALIADDPITRDGAFARLSTYDQITVLDADQQEHARVLLVLVTEVNDDILSRLEHAYSEAAECDLSVVLVAAAIEERHLLRAIRAGLVSLLPRQRAGFDLIVRAVVAALHGRAVLPQVTQRYLIEQLRTVDRDVLAPLDLTVPGLTIRAVEVLKLLSEGLDTREVAARLECSESTVTTIVRTILTRFKLRNRTQAVAFALRSGVL
jgi:DNA-binding NarL/FixJ family response regulator